MTSSWDWLGRVDYEPTLARQLALREQVWAGGDGLVLLCEHPPVITLGRSANRANVLAAGDVPVVPIERGGDVTYHGPGQLMVYPIVRVKSVVDFLSRVAAALADACAVFGVTGAEWRRDPAGLWLGPAKLGACGIHVARGVSTHGWALNVATPEDAWRRIRPCGLSVPQVSVSSAAGREIRVEDVAREAGPRICQSLVA
jgi:lipoyl(octanoyl) transferase